MAIHLSAGVSTLVALMAAHRTSSGRGDPFTQAEIEEIESRLQRALEPRQETARSRTPRRTGPSTDATDSA
jgi:predicted neutral ceramidase superfamily lipid hydrolase